MKILFHKRDSFVENDVIDALQRLNIDIDFISHRFSETEADNSDLEFVKKFNDITMNITYDALFSTKYYFLLAKLCSDRGMKYISWNYDNPLRSPGMELNLDLPTNYVFFFDRIQTQTFKSKGFTTVYHMPLAANTARLDRKILTPKLRNLYSCDISFVGNMYPSNYPILREPLSDYDKGFLDAAIDTQSQIYGSYFLDALITNELLARINKRYREKNFENGVQITREILSFALATQITHHERLVILALLSNRYNLSYYSKVPHDTLTNAKYRGTVHYSDDMPYVFKASKINLNITLKINQSGIPLRCFDIMGCGGFLLSNYQEELFDFFKEDVDIVTYSSYEEVLDKVAFYLKNDSERTKIARNGYQKVCKYRTHKIVVSEILKIAGLL